MSAIATAPIQPIQPKLPTHLDLPDTDGKPVDNTYQPIQWKILFESLTPHMYRLHPDGRFLVAMDHGIYFEIVDPPLDGCRAADLLVVEGVAPVPKGCLYRRSYVMWQDIVAPTLVLELVSGNGREEHDRTPKTGKFWIYEKAIRAGYYVIYDPEREVLEVFQLVGTEFRPVPPNSRGHFPIPALGIEVGLIQGTLYAHTGLWVRFFDDHGNLLPIADELVVLEQQRAAELGERAEQESKRAEQESKRAEQESKRAEHENKRAEQLEQEKANLLKRLRDLGAEPNGH